MHIAQQGLLLILLVSAMTAPAAAAVYFTSSAPGIITKGDAFTVSGTGAVNGTVGIWIVGRDHFEVLTTLPDRHGNFSLTIRPTATDTFSSGQYAVIFQDPGKGGVLEIEGGTDVNGSLVVMNKGKIVARLGHRQDLGENIKPAAGRILDASLLPGVDDQFSARYFFVEEPAIFFSGLIPASGFRLPERIAGEPVDISGTTNIGTENTLVTDILSQDSHELIMTEVIPISAGSSMNRWKWDLDAPGLPAGNYEITVAHPGSNTTIQGVFSVVLPAHPPVSPSNVPPELPPARESGDYTFPVFIAATLIVLAIVLYYAGRG